VVSAATAAHHWRSQLLGERLEFDLPAGRLAAFRRGQGPPLVFAHGWLANANLWRHVIERLADCFTCVAFDLPLGAHRVALPHADLSPLGCGHLIADALDALELEAVTLVGNDSGGAYAQIAASQRGERVARLVLNSCETPYDPFPPPPFDGLPALARDPRALGELLGALRDRAVRTAPVAFGLLVKYGLPDEVSDSYALPCVEDEAILADTARVMASASSDPVHSAGQALIESFERPVLFAWSPEDRVFPIAHARRYAEALPDGRLIEIGDSYSFTPEDQPNALADALAGFAA
jgi:pimeloyl-ACP methyl ester carboxylesterase